MYGSSPPSSGAPGSFSSPGSNPSPGPGSPRTPGLTRTDSSFLFDSQRQPNARCFTLRRYGAKAAIGTATAEGKRVHYTAPADVKITQEFYNPSRHTYPAYIGGDGTFYTVDYIPITSTSSATPDAGDVFDVSSLEKGVSKLHSLPNAVASFPQPEYYSTYEEFEAAVCAWKESVKQAVGPARLPHTVGRALSRPNADGALNRNGLLEAGEADDGNGRLMPLSEDPWDAVLVPPEPDPMFYESYDQYELAMERWHSECVKRMPYIVPNVSQMPDLAEFDITPAKEVLTDAEGAGNIIINSGNDDSVSFHTMSEPRIGYVNPHSRFIDTFYDADYEELQSLIAATSKTKPEVFVKPADWPKELLSMKLTVSPDAGKSSGGARSNLCSLMKELEDELLETISPSGFLNEDAVSSTTNELASIPPNLESTCEFARARAVTNENILSVPYACNLRETIEKARQKKWRSPYEDRALDDFSNPQLLATVQAEAEEFKQWVAGLETYTGDTLIHIIQTTTLRYDTFVQVMESPYPGAAAGITFFYGMTEVVDQPVFKKLLDSWDLHCDPLVLGRFAWVIRSLVTARPDLIAGVFSEPAPYRCRHLTIITQTLTFFDKCPQDVFAFSLEGCAEPLDAALGSWPEKPKDVRPSTYSIMLYDLLSLYYLEKIDNVVPGIQAVIRGESLKQHFVTSLKERQDLVNCLFELMWNKNAELSNMALVVTLRLLWSTDKIILDYINSDKNRVYGQLYTLSKSRFSHAQFAARQLTSRIFVEPSLSLEMMDFFAKKPQLVDCIIDIPVDPGGAMSLVLDAEMAAEHKLMLRTHSTTVWLVKKACMTALDYASSPDGTKAVDASKYTWMMGDQSYKSFLKLLPRAISGSAFVSASALADMLESLCSLSVEQGHIEMEGEAKSKKEPGRNANLIISINEKGIDTMIDAVNSLLACKPPVFKKNGKPMELLRSNCPGTNDGSVTDHALINIATAIVKTLTHLLRHKGVVTKSLPKLAPELLRWCRCGRSIGFSQASWNLFFELFEWHSGIVEWMDSHDYMKNFISITGMTDLGEIPLLFSLRYVRKLLWLFKEEQDRVKRKIESEAAVQRMGAKMDKQHASKAVIRDDGRSCEKDVKYIVAILQKNSSFVPMHIVFGKLSKRPPTMCYLEIAKFFSTIATVPECSRLYAFLQKNEAYKASLEKALNLSASGIE